MKNFCIVALLAIASAFAADGATRSYIIHKPFDKIEATGQPEVVFSVGPTMNISATTEADFMKYVSVTLKGSTLIVSYNPRNEKKVPEAVITITAPSVASFTATGNSEIEIKTPLKASSLTLSAAGNSSIEVEHGASADNANATASGNSTIDIDGIATFASLTASALGNSSLDIDNLSAKTVKATSAGNATIDLEGSADHATLVASGNSTLDADDLKASTGSASASGNSTLKCNIRKPDQVTSAGNASARNRR